jgi:hypothetical protein
VLRAWRAGCPELRALWGEAADVAAWEGVTLGEAGGAAAGRVVRIDLRFKVGRCRWHPVEARVERDWLQLLKLL